MQDPFEPLPPKLGKRITGRGTGNGIIFLPIKAFATLIILLVTVYVALS